MEDGLEKQDKVTGYILGLLIGIAIHVLLQVILSTLLGVTAVVLDGNSDLSMLIFSISLVFVVITPPIASLLATILLYKRKKFISMGILTVFLVIYILLPIIATILIVFGLLMLTLLSYSSVTY